MILEWVKLEAEQFTGKAEIEIGKGNLFWGSQNFDSHHRTGL